MASLGVDFDRSDFDVAAVVAKAARGGEDSGPDHGRLAASAEEADGFLRDLQAKLARTQQQHRAYHSVKKRESGQRNHDDSPYGAPASHI